MADECIRSAMDQVAKRARRSALSDKLSEDKRPHTVFTISLGELDEEPEEESEATPEE